MRTLWQNWGPLLPPLLMVAAVIALYVAAVVREVAA